MRIEARDLGIGDLFWRVREAVVGADVDAERVVLWNPSAERVFGYTEAEALGMPLDLLVPERLRAAHRGGIERFRATGRGAVIDASSAVEVAALRKDGSEIPVDLTLVRADALRPGSFVVALIRDASERKRTEAERLARIEAEAALRAMDAFLSVAAHELKTPVTALRLVAQGALRRMEREQGPHPDWLRHTVARLDTESARLGLLSQQVLDAARAEAGLLVLTVTTVDVTDVVGSALRRLAPADRSRVTFSAPARVQWAADATRLESVVAGLVDHAARSVPEAPIAVAVEPTSAALRIIVRCPTSVPLHGLDLPGWGIEEGGNARHTGFGLALHLCRRVVELHGGTVGAAATASGQTRIVLTLPRP